MLTAALKTAFGLASIAHATLDLHSQKPKQENSTFIIRNENQTVNKPVEASWVIEPFANHEIIDIERPGFDPSQVKEMAGLLLCWKLPAGDVCHRLYAPHGECTSLTLEEGSGFIASGVSIKPGSECAIFANPFCEYGKPPYYPTDQRYVFSKGPVANLGDFFKGTKPQSMECYPDPIYKFFQKPRSQTERVSQPTVHGNGTTPLNSHKSNSTSSNIVRRGFQEESVSSKGLIKNSGGNIKTIIGREATKVCDARQHGVYVPCTSDNQCSKVRPGSKCVPYKPIQAIVQPETRISAVKAVSTAITKNTNDTLELMSRRKKKKNCCKSKKMCERLLLGPHGPLSHFTCCKTDQDCLVGWNHFTNVGPCIEDHRCVEHRSVKPEASALPTTQTARSVNFKPGDAASGGNNENLVARGGCCKSAKRCAKQKNGHYKCCSTNDSCATRGPCMQDQRCHKIRVNSITDQNSTQSSNLKKDDTSSPNLPAAAYLQRVKVPVGHRCITGKVCYNSISGPGDGKKRAVVYNCCNVNRDCKTHGPCVPDNRPVMPPDTRDLRDSSAVSIHEGRCTGAAKVDAPCKKDNDCPGKFNFCNNWSTEKRHLGNGDRHDCEKGCICDSAMKGTCAYEKSCGCRKRSNSLPPQPLEIVKPLNPKTTGKAPSPPITTHSVSASTGAIEKGAELLFLDTDNDGKAEILDIVHLKNDEVDEFLYFGFEDEAKPPMPKNAKEQEWPVNWRPGSVQHNHPKPSKHISSRITTLTGMKTLSRTKHSAQERSTLSPPQHTGHWYVEDHETFPGSNTKFLDKRTPKDQSHDPSIVEDVIGILFQADRDGRCTVSGDQQATFIVVALLLLIVAGCMWLHTWCRISAFFHLLLVCLLIACLIVFCLFGGIMGLGLVVCAFVKKYGRVPVSRRVGLA